MSPALWLTGVLLVLALGLPALVLALLAVPVAGRAEARVTPGGVDLRSFSLDWPGGWPGTPPVRLAREAAGVPLGVAVFGRPVSRGRRASPAAVPRRPGPRKVRRPARPTVPFPLRPWRWFWLAMDLLATGPAVAQEVGHLLSRLAGSVRVRGEASGQFGFDDPADTGMAWAALMAGPWRGLATNLTPDFTCPVLDLRVSVAARGRPLAAAWAMGRFFLARPVRRWWWQRWRRRARARPGRASGLPAGAASGGT